MMINEYNTNLPEFIRSRGFVNTCVDTIGFAYYHCALQTHSTEYGYMGHPYRFTGLYKTSKHDPRFHLYRLRHSIEIGWTWLNEKQIDEIFDNLQSSYLGWNYHTSKNNSIHFAKQFSHDLQLKHLQPIDFPPYVDRGRRLCETLEFLQIFDSEKEIAEVNILYFLYMKHQGNIREICQLLQLDTSDQLKRSIELIDQGIRQRKLPIFPLFTTFDIRRADEYFYNNQTSNVQLTLTEIFHQFDTITLRGRTSIDRYLNIQRTNQMQTEEKDQIKPNVEMFSPNHRSSHPQAISQNQGRTPLISPSGSYRSDLLVTTRLPGTSNNLDLSLEHRSLPKLRSIRSDLPHRQRKFPRPRKLPRDLELTNDLYIMKNPDPFIHNYTNNASSHSHQSIISFEKIFLPIDSSV